MMWFPSYCIAVSIALSACGSLPHGLAVHTETEFTNKGNVMSKLKQPSIFQVGLGKFAEDSNAANEAEHSSNEVVNLKPLSTNYKLANYFKLCPTSMVCRCTMVSFPPKQRYSGMNERSDKHEKILANIAAKQSKTNGLAAKWVDSFNRQHAFIASRAPLERNKTDVFDFWNVVWHTHVYIIVMLTPINADNKIAQYWPDEQDKTKYIEGRYNYKVTSLSIDNCDKGGYECSTLNLTRVDGKHRVVTHCLFSEWPDMDVPRSTEQLLAFRRHVKKLASAPKKGSDTAISEARPADTPILVHCFAGLGRTGTFIALDVLIERMDVELHHPVDVAGVVERLRVRRPGSVLCKEQYNFLVTALQVYKCSGDRIMVC